MIPRMLIVTLCFVAATVVVRSAARSEVVPSRQSLSAFPLEIGQWHGRSSAVDAAILEELGVDEHVNAVYRNEHTQAVGVYVGYYASQRQGDTIHSPANCLPGGGWQPVVSDRLEIRNASPAGPIEVTRWVIQRGEERQLVLYWYQSRGRVVASDYWNKVYLVLDSIRFSRSDGALVRVITPIDGPSDEALAEAEGIAVGFVRSLFPLLDRFLPA